MLSIIIPAYNEAAQISETIRHTISAAKGVPIEVIVVDGKSTDDTAEEAKSAGAFVIRAAKKGRAAQMNEGAAAARYPVLYFLHADSLPPEGFAGKIAAAIQQGYAIGCFRLEFDQEHWFLKLNAWFTRFDVNAVRFGDQSLFVSKEIFDASGGFREDLMMMEDQEIIHRLKKHGRFIVLPDKIVTSARKYLDNGVFRMQWIFYRLWAMYYLGYSQEKMLRLHRKLIKKHKL